MNKILKYIKMKIKEHEILILKNVNKDVVFLNTIEDLYFLQDKIIEDINNKIVKIKQFL